MTKYSLIIFTLLSLLGGMARADTTWVAAGFVSGTWTEDDSPFMISAGDVIVGADAVLAITEGVTVHFTGPYTFQVNGGLIAAGLEGDSIYFTSDPDSTPGGWRGLRFLNAGTGSSLSYCVIERGRASGAGSLRYGGGVECQNSSPSFNDCTIRYNTAIIDGGGVYTREGSNPVFERCVFQENIATAGGGALVCRANSDPVLRDCEFIANTAASGGGVYCGSGADPQLMNCRFIENESWLGGGFYCENSTATPSLTNCLFVGNVADSSGGGAYLRNTDGVIRYCNFYGNFSPWAGGLHIETALAFIRNSIIAYSSEGRGVRFVNSPSVTIESCDIYEHPAGLFEGAGPEGFGELTRQNLHFDSCDIYLNIFLSPRFVDAEAGDFHLSDESPCIASGTAGAGLPADAEGSERPRPVGTLPDQGMYENATGSPQQICGTMTGSLGPGVVAVTCDIEVPRAGSLTLEAGTSLLFTGDYTLRIEGILLSLGSEDQPVVISRFFDDPGTFWGGIEMVDAGRSRLINTTIENAHIPETSERTSGGALYVEGSVAELINCTIRYSEAQTPSGEGGGVFVSEGSFPIIENCRITENSAGLKGGGLSVDETSAVTFTDGIVSGNSCGLFGGGVYLHQSASNFTEVEISDNTSGSKGGGIYSWWSTPVFRRCQITVNNSGEGGGAYVNNSMPQFINCTISGNVAALGGGLHLYQTSARVKNSIIANSTGEGIHFELNNIFGAFEYNDFYANEPVNFGALENAPMGLGILSTENFNGDLCDTYLNILLDPQFADAPEGDYNLEPDSPCINAGDWSEQFDADSSVADMGRWARRLDYEPSTAFDLLSPPDGHGVNENDLELIWQRSIEDETQLPVPFYRVEISEDALFSTVFLNWTVTDTSVLVAGLADSATYWWRVRAIGSNGIARSSNQRWSVYTVTTNPPTPFALLQPVDEDTILTTQSQLFCWQQSVDIDGGDVVVFTLKIQGVDTLLTFVDLTDTCLNIVPVLLGLRREGNVEWWVTASSQIPDTTIECLQRFHFFLDDPNQDAEESGALPREFALHANFPNPFNASTTIEFDLPVAVDVRLYVMNLLGQVVAEPLSGRQEAGAHRLIWEASELPSGVYVAVLAAGEFRQARKLMLLK